MFGQATYLLFELVWAAPVLLIQWLAGPRSLWEQRRPLLLATAAATLYLSLADAFAIHSGIWTINAQRTVRVVLGPLPLEEIVFFLLTTMMVVQSIALLRSHEPLRRLKTLLRLFARES